MTCLNSVFAAGGISGWVAEIVLNREPSKGVFLDINMSDKDYFT